MAKYGPGGVFSRNAEFLTDRPQDWPDDPALIELGQSLRDRLDKAVETLLQLKTESALKGDKDNFDQSMRVRKTYLLPLHLVQAELMRRRRQYLEQGQEQTPVDHALMVTIAGIAAGLRNTG